MSKIAKITISNYKSISHLELSLGRLNVLIGENGSGKSNVLEAIALASCAAQNTLDNDALASRGIRVTDPAYMRSGFHKQLTTKPIQLKVVGEDVAHEFE